MAKNNKLEYRMYGLVPYNISPIQQAIQYGHALQEYNNSLFKEFFDDKWKGEEKSEDFYKFQKWANEDKTFIILNGGTTNMEWDSNLCRCVGTLNEHQRQLDEHSIRNASFHEPDLNNALTAVVFLVDERVFDKKKYPNFEDYMKEKVATNIIAAILDSEKICKEWVEMIGGETNVWLREFLSQFKMA